MLSVEIDGKQVQVESGATIMDAATKAGIYIPHFCYHEKLSIAANCRMCLVQVEKAAKPLPACATPVTDGMKVQTRSAVAVQAQKGVMEFLLINHPLDCPICDQGGECELQDLAVGYGSGKSRYQEDKRVVENKDLGPLVATDMTRCINCTRCVRFCQEVAGVTELGQAFRGEHAEIMPFLGQTVDSELSGNIIDLCPVGALTSKPFRYTARTWELARRKSVSPHDSLGSNLQVHVKDGRVMRVLPLTNEATNECWLSDRDRFSYEGLNSPDRLERPMVREGGRWVETDWQTALERVRAGLADTCRRHGPDAVGALAAPNQTLEEYYLLQKLMRGLGTGNIDHRLRQADFSLDGAHAGALWLGLDVAQLDKLRSVLLIGSRLRKEHPLIAHRLRETCRRHSLFAVLAASEEDYLCNIRPHMVTPPSAWVARLAKVYVALCGLRGTPVPEWGKEIKPAAEEATLAQNLMRHPSAVLLGNQAQHHPAFAQILWLAQEIAGLAGAAYGIILESPNGLGAQVAGAVPYQGPLGAAARGGMNARRMWEEPRKAYVLLGLEPELDCQNPGQVSRALRQSDFVVSLSPYRHRARDYANVILPIAPFTETSGTFINLEGSVQSFRATVKPYAEARPAWKVLRVLGTMLELPGFDYDESEAIRDELLGGQGDARIAAFLNNRVEAQPLDFNAAQGLQRLGEIPLYQSDAIVRRATSLQRTAIAAGPRIGLSGAMMDALGLLPGSILRVRQGGGQAALPVERDETLAPNCVRVPGGHELTAELGPLFGEITLEAP